MSTKTIVDNEFVTVWYHPEAKIIHHQFHKPAGGPSFRDALTAGAEVLEKNSAQKWLSDDVNNSALAAEDSEWAMNVWNARVMKAGWKFWAIVMPKKAMGQMNMKHFIKLYSDNGVTVQLYDNPEDALKWLESV
jgi:hypothetical protein